MPLHFMKNLIEETCAANVKSQYFDRRRQNVFQLTCKLLLQVSVDF